MRVEDAAGAAAAVGGELAILGQACADGGQDAVAHILGEFSSIGIQDLSVRLDDRYMTAGDGDAGLTIEGDLIRSEDAPLLPGLHVAACDYELLVLLVFDLVSAEGHRSIAIDRRTADVRLRVQSGGREGAGERHRRGRQSGRTAPSRPPREEAGRRPASGQRRRAPRPRASRAWRPIGRTAPPFWKS